MIRAPPSGLVRDWPRKQEAKAKLLKLLADTPGASSARRILVIATRDDRWVVGQARRMVMIVRRVFGMMALWGGHFGFLRA